MHEQQATTILTTLYCQSLVMLSHAKDCNADMLNSIAMLHCMVKPNARHVKDAKKVDNILSCSALVSQNLAVSATSIAGKVVVCDAAATAYT